MKLTNQQAKSLFKVLSELREMIKTGTSPPSIDFQPPRIAIIPLLKGRLVPLNKIIALNIKC